jgi:AcrR family transcriptional regulator
LVIRTGTLQKLKQQVVREAIWNAAIDLFTKQGFDETTVEDIAEAAGVSRRSFFRYFASKDDLMAQGMHTYGALLSEEIHACPSSLSPFEVLKRTTLEAAAKITSQPRTLQLIKIGEDSAAAREAEVSCMAAVENSVAQAFRRRCRISAKQDLKAKLLASLTLTILNLSIGQWAKNPRRDISPIILQALSELDQIVSAS